MPATKCKIQQQLQLIYTHFLSGSDPIVLLFHWP